MLSAREFSRGTLSMMRRLSDLEDLGFALGILYGLIYRMDRAVDARLTAESIRQMTFGPSQGRVPILNTVIPATIAYREAAAARLPVHRFEPVRKGPTPSGLESMLGLVRELPLELGEASLSVSSRRRCGSPSTRSIPTTATHGARATKLTI